MLLNSFNTSFFDDFDRALYSNFFGSANSACGHACRSRRRPASLIDQVFNQFAQPRRVSFFDEPTFDDEDWMVVDVDVVVPVAKKSKRQLKREKEQQEQEQNNEAQQQPPTAETENTKDDVATTAAPANETDQVTVQEKPTTDVAVFNRRAFFATPQFAVNDADGTVTIEADLTAQQQFLNKDNLAVELHDGSLVVSGYLEAQSEGSRAFSQFSRSFALPENVDESQIQAKFENGRLIVSFPSEKKENNAVKIPIQENTENN